MGRQTYHGEINEVGERSPTLVDPHTNEVGEPAPTLSGSVEVSYGPSSSSPTSRSIVYQADNRFAFIGEGLRFSPDGVDASKYRAARRCLKGVPDATQSVGEVGSGLESCCGRAFTLWLGPGWP